ncbi:MAG: phosphoadenosine phosphosulfate reductase family protein, partial [Dietzia cercidiphylli]
MTARTAVTLSHLDALEAESVHIFREVAAQFERPGMLFSGGKDSVVMFHLARKAFWPAPMPFPLMHVDTGHNFDEVIEYRDRVVEETGVQLLVSYVQDDIDAGRVVEETGVSEASRADRIASATRRTITEKMDEDPTFYRSFSELLEETIRD